MNCMVAVCCCLLCGRYEEYALRRTRRVVFEERLLQDVGEVKLGRNGVEALGRYCWKAQRLVEGANGQLHVVADKRSSRRSVIYLEW